MTLKQGIHARLEHLLVREKLERVDALTREIGEQSRELDELRGWIPLWDRVMVYDPTPNEERAEAIKLALEPRRRVLAQLRTEIDADFERVGNEYPPFGIGVAAERCFRIAREHLRVEGFLSRHVAEQDALTDALQELADRVIETWVRDFQPTHMFRTLSDPERCAAAAAGTYDALDADPRLGVAPILERHLLALVAQRLRASEFFAERAKLKELRAELALAESSFQRADQSIPLLSRLSPFQGSRAHLRRDEQRERRAALEEATQRQFETTRRLLHRALTAYPPLAIHQRVVEAAGVAKLLGVEWERNLSPEGEVVDRELVAPRALVFAALSRLLETFVEVFPDVPLPLQVRLELSDPNVGRRRSPRELLIQEFQDRLDASWASELRDQALEHAGMEGSLSRRRSRGRGSGSIVERIVAWSDPRGRRRQERLAERGAWHAQAAIGSWERLLGAARSVAETLAPLAARDLAIRASDDLSQLQVDPGDAPFPPAREVDGKHRVLGTLSALARTLGEHYGLEGTRADLVAALSDTAPAPAPTDAPFEPLAYADVLARLASKLDQDSLRAAHARITAALPAPDEHGFTAWDQSGELLAAQPPALRQDLAEVTRLLEGAFDAYPPARLYYTLDVVRAQVSNLSVRVIEERVRGMRRYRAELVGLAEARAALRAWCASLAATFGVLPDPHELLEHWALRGFEERAL